MVLLRATGCAPFVVAAILSATNIGLIGVMLPESLKAAKRRPFAFKRANLVGAFTILTGDPILRRLVEVSVNVIAEVATVRFAILIGMATLTTLVFISSGNAFLPMIPLIAICFVAAPPIQGMLSQLIGEDRQGELIGSDLI